MQSTATLLLAAAAALVSAEISQEGDDRRDALLQNLRSLLGAPKQPVADTIAALIASAAWEATPEEMPRQRELATAALELAAFDRDPANARPSVFDAFIEPEPEDDYDPREDQRREYEAALLSPLDRERMDPRTYG